MKGLISDIGIIDKTKQKNTCHVKVTNNSISFVEKRKLYIESYGCQMNFSDSEIVVSILEKEGFVTTSLPEEAEVILINTCSIREKAEQKIYNRLDYFGTIKKLNPEVIIGVLGCMAERLKTQLLEEKKIVDLILGPDAYRDLPKLVEKAESGQKAINVFLSREETYADIAPVRLNSNGVSAFISIMRGCDNMCSFCVVPFTRGRERSRNPYSILKEAQELFSNGYREITLLGQNVDSYKWSKEEINTSCLENRLNLEVVKFHDLLELLAQIHPNLRIRFSTSHPKDITDDVLYTMKKYDNICKYIHLPAQSGNSRILKLMNRTYNREWYMERINTIKKVLGNECGISSDMIAGFCSETEKEHKDTLSLMEYVQYDFSYMFYYSERPGTLASKKYKDDIPLAVKKRRLQEIIDTQQKISFKKNQLTMGKIFEVLVEGKSKRSDSQMQGRNTANKVVVFEGKQPKGKYVNVKINDYTTATLFGKVV